MKFTFQASACQGKREEQDIREAFPRFGQGQGKSIKEMACDQVHAKGRKTSTLSQRPGGAAGMRNEACCPNVRRWSHCARQEEGVQYAAEPGGQGFSSNEEKHQMTSGPEL
jgi:hypothetical protein